MVNIITGNINSGKTSRLLKLYEDSESADGFVAIKNMMNHRVIGYDMHRLATRERRSFIVRDNLLPEGFDVMCTIGPYCFSRDTIEWVEQSLRHMIAHGTQAIFLDEIGPLELEGQCFDGIMSELVMSGCELYVTVRKEAVDAVIDRYGITDYKTLVDDKTDETLTEAIIKEVTEF